MMSAGSTSAKTGTAPQIETAEAVAKKVKARTDHLVPRSDAGDKQRRVEGGRAVRDGDGVRYTTVCGELLFKGGGDRPLGDHAGGEDSVALFGTEGRSGRSGMCMDHRSPDVDVMVLSRSLIYGFSFLTGMLYRNA